jgi:NAD(P)-dependent dehydrogenase (short-subunit alcohol dehydrogenase family)
MLAGRVDGRTGTGAAFATAFVTARASLVMGATTSATDSPTVLASRAAPGAPATRSQRILDRREVPDDLLGTLIYLSSPASEFVTGQTLVVDGGSYLH